MLLCLTFTYVLHAPVLSTLDLQLCVRLVKLSRYASNIRSHTCGTAIPLVQTVPGELETNVGSDAGIRVVLIRGTVVVLATGSDVECRTSWELHMSPTLR